MKNIAVLGTGAMGSRMARGLLKAGNRVVIWNRTKERARPLLDQGAVWADTAKAAALGADYVLSMVRDDQAARDVWLDPTSGALTALTPESVALECSTLSVPFFKELALAFVEQNKTLVDAPLAGSRPQAEAGQLIFFVGGPSDTVERLRSVLEPLAGAIHHTGEQGSGVVVKLMVNALFGAQLGVIAELIGFAQKTGINVSQGVEILSATPVCSPAAKIAANAMVNRVWNPAFPIDLVAKDFELLTRSAQLNNASLPLGDALKTLYSKGVEQGLAEDNITGIVQLYLNE